MPDLCRGKVGLLIQAAFVAIQLALFIALGAGPIVG